MTSTRAAIYLRLSIDKAGDELGVTRQREDCLRLCQAKGWEPVEYMDNDLSATKGVRPAYRQMLQDIRDKRIDAVAAWHLDRLHRQPAELEEFITLADKHNIALATVTGDVNLATDNGRLIARITGAVARAEIERKSARQRRAGQQKAERGLPQWNHAFGYLSYTGAKEHDKGERFPDPRTAPLVVDAYRAILAGASLNDVCRMWNDAGAFTAHGHNWTAALMTQFLRKPRNAGLRDYNDELIMDGDGKPVRGTWEPLVDVELWQSVQHLMNDPKRNPGPKSVQKYLLTGFLRCGRDDCGGTMGGQHVTHKTGGKSGRPKAGEVKEKHSGQIVHSHSYNCRKCHACSIRGAAVENVIYGLVGDRLARADAVDLLKKEQHNPEEAQRIRDEINTLTTKLAKRRAEWDDDEITTADYNYSKDRTNAKIAALEAQQQDQDRLRVFDGIPLGQPEAVEAVLGLSEDRFRAVASVLIIPSVLPIGSGHRRNPKDRIVVSWLVPE